MTSHQSMTISLASSCPLKLIRDQALREPVCAIGFDF